MMLKGMMSLLLAGQFFFATLPATTNYELQSYGFGSGGTADSSTSNYSLEGITGEVSGANTSTTNYTTVPGYIGTQQANVPNITLSNPSNYYNELTFTLDTQNNPSDATFLLQISTSPTFASGNDYVTTSDTLSSTLSTSYYQTAAAWTASGDKIIGLASSTTYYIHALATQGQFTETQYGPSSSAATVGQQISFCTYTGASCGTGNTIAFGSVTPNTITTAPSNINVNFATNADGGGEVYIQSLYGGLNSPSNSYTISSATANLSAVSQGYGAQSSSSTQTSGGPFSSVSPYNGSANNVGALTSTFSSLYTTSAPVVGGSGVVKLLLLTSVAPDANDYTDTLTLVAAASF